MICKQEVSVHGGDWYCAPLSLSCGQGDQSASVWVFLGEESRWPSAVFGSREPAERWIGEHGLTGMLTEYPLDTGVYDCAVANGCFRPSKPAHNSPGFSAGFTTARQNHVHFVDGTPPALRYGSACHRMPASRRTKRAMAASVSSLDGMSAQPIEETFEALEDAKSGVGEYISWEDVVARFDSSR